MARIARREEKVDRAMNVIAVDPREMYAQTSTGTGSMRKVEKGLKRGLITLESGARPEKKDLNRKNGKSTKERRTAGFERNL